MKSIKVLRSLIFFLISVNTQGQTVDEIAHGSPDGIFVITGMNVVSKDRPVDNIIGYRIERRRTAAGNWTELARVSAPEGQKNFENRLRIWCNRYPDWADFNKVPVAELHRKLNRTGRIDSLRMWGQILPVRLAAGTLFLDSTITDTLKYEYRISVIPTSGEPQILYASGPVKKSIRTDLGNLSLVKRLVTDRDVTLVWKQDAGYKPVFYRIYRKGENEPVFNRLYPLISRYTRSDTTFLVTRDTLVTKGEVYHYYVEPMEYYGKAGKPSSTVKTGIYSFNSIRLPHNLAYEPVLPTGGIRLKWEFDMPAEIKSLLVFKSADYDTGYRLLKRISPLDTVFIDPAVEPMKKYYYYLVMEGHFGELSEPGVRVFGIAENRIPPQAPDIVKAEGIKNGVKLEIALHTIDIKGIRIYRKTENQDEFKLISPLLEYKGESVFYTDTSRVFTGYSSLFYTVQAENTSYALSPFSDTVSVYPLSESLPLAPDQIEITYEQKRVHLLWDDITGNNPALLGYRLFRRKMDGKPAPGPTFDLIYDGFMKPGRNYYTDSLALEGITYEYQVKGVDFYGKESKTGPVARIAIPKEKPVPPSGMTVLVTDDGLLIEWEEPIMEGIESYKLYRYQRGLKPSVQAVLNSGVTQYTDKTTKKGQLYFYYLTTVLKNGNESEPGREEGIWK